jgi:hypothetical protein
MESVKSRPATQDELNALQNKMKKIHQRRVKNNFKNIEAFATLEGFQPHSEDRGQVGIYWKQKEELADTVYYSANPNVMKERVELTTGPDVLEHRMNNGLPLNYGKSEILTLEGTYWKLRGKNTVYWSFDKNNLQRDIKFDSLEKDDDLMTHRAGHNFPEVDKAVVTTNNTKDIQIIDDFDQYKENEGKSQTADYINMLNMNSNMIKDNVDAEKNKWKDTFRFLTELEADDFGKPKGWQRILETIFFAIPRVIDLAIDDFVKTVPMTQEDGLYADYLEKRFNDKQMIVHSAYEFFYVLFTMYFSHMIYSRIYTKNRLLSMEYLIGYVCSQFPALSDFIDQYLTCFLQFPCDAIFFMVTQGIPTLFSMFFVANYPTLRMFCLFLIIYMFCYHFMGTWANMFLQIFEFKANPSIYMFILIGWISYCIKHRYTIREYIFKLKIFYFLFTILHLIFSFVVAPLAQLMFVLYCAYTFLGSPMDILSFITSWFIPETDTFFQKAAYNIAGSNNSDPETLFGSFDKLSYKYGYRFFFFFVMILFFFFKTIQSATELQVSQVRQYIGTTNAYITATMLIIYLAKYFQDDPMPTQDFSVSSKLETETMPETTETTTAATTTETTTITPITPITAVATPPPTIPTPPAI